MNDELFLKISNEIGDQHLDDFSYEHDGKIYGFKYEESDWKDEGKYQHREESGVLCEYDENYNVISLFDYGLSRSSSRSGSYFSDYYYDNDKYSKYKIVDVVIPEVVIPEHTEKRWDVMGN